MKSALVSAPVLVYTKFGSENTNLETNASKVGLGAVLSQMQDGTIHPVVYVSHSTNKHEKNYGISKLETLGLVWAVRYFYLYILVILVLSTQTMQHVSLSRTRPNCLENWQDGLSLSRRWTSPSNIKLVQRTGMLMLSPEV